jgi:rubrerythrin
MAGPIYKLWLNRFKEAWYQLSEEEQSRHLAKVQEILKKVGAKPVMTCTPAWSAEQWAVFGMTEFPDIEAVQKSVALFSEIGHYRYVEAETMLGTRFPPS